MDESPPLSLHYYVLHTPDSSQGKFQFHSPFFDPVSEEAKDLINQMLTRDPATRPSGRSG